MIGIEQFISFDNDTYYTKEIMVDTSDREVRRILSIDTISGQLKGLQVTFVEEFVDIDYDDVKLSLEYWSIEQLLKLPFTAFGSDYFDAHVKNATATSFYEWLNDKVLCPDSDPDKARKYWVSNGTWMTPIIIVKSNDFPTAHLKRPYQLFEGHTRLYWLRVLDKYKNVPIHNNHLVWVIKKKI